MPTYRLDSFTLFVCLRLGCVATQRPLAPLIQSPVTASGSYPITNKQQCCPCIQQTRTLLNRPCGKAHSLHLRLVYHCTCHLSIGLTNPGREMCAMLRHPDGTQTSSALPLPCMKMYRRVVSLRHLLSRQRVPPLGEQQITLQPPPSLPKQQLRCCASMDPGYATRRKPTSAEGERNCAPSHFKAGCWGVSTPTHACS